MRTLAVLLCAAVSGCAVEPTPTPRPSTPSVDPRPLEPTNIEGDLSAWAGEPFSHTPGRTALDKANHERRTQYGTGVLLPDPALQRLALEKARYAAEHAIDGHIGGSQGGAQCEGVATTKGQFLSCCMDVESTHGGAAMVQGRDAWYCCLLVR